MTPSNALKNTMLTRKNKTTAVNEKPLPARATKILVSEYQNHADEMRPTSTLGLADVIYENINENEDEKAEYNGTQSPKSRSAVFKTVSNISYANSNAPDVYSSANSKKKGNSPGSKANGGKSPSVSPTLNGTGNKVSPSGQNDDETPSILNNGNGNIIVNGAAPSTTNIDKTTGLRRKRAVSMQEHKQETKKKKKTTQSVKLDRHSKPVSVKTRRDSGIHLLSSSSETSMIYDSINDFGVGGQAETASASESSSSAASSRSTSVRTLAGKALLSPEESWLSTVETKLCVAALGNPSLTLQQFKDALQVKESFFVDRCFQIFDKDGDGEVNLQALIDELRALVNGTQIEKMRFLFKVYNIRGTGKIVKSEVHQVLKSCIEESQIQISPEDLESLTDAFVLAADTDRDGRVSFDEFRDLVERHPTIAENLAVSTLMATSRSGIEDFPVDDTVPGEPHKRRRCCRHFSRYYIQNNLKRIVFLFIYLLVNAGLGAINGWRYWDHNNWIIVARVCGLCLNFNSVFILVLMFRGLITKLRATPLVEILPIDQHRMFHKICGYFIALQSLVHTVAHCGNAYIVASEKRMSAAEVIFTTKADIGWVAGTAPLTGVFLCIVLFVMILLSQSFIRRSGYFEVFYWSHKLYIVYWALLIIHAKDFWKWFVVPGLVFIIESIIRLPWIRSAYRGRTYIESVCLLPSQVTQIVITRPAGFTFKPGDYVFIQIPAIAKYEWHPFTISSAPEQSDTLWLHIRSIGSWTKSLHDYFVNYEYSDVEAAGDPEAENYDTLKKCNLRRRPSSIAWGRRKPLKARRIASGIRKRVVTKCTKVLCHIDGPYGTPSRHIFEAEHAVLVGSGIGITPFASILQSIVNQFKASCVKCPRCEYTWCHQPPASVMNLKKVDFIWINRDQRHFEWFVSLLSRLEREQEIEGGLGHILDMHMYMTSAPPKTDMKGLGLQLALDLIHENEGTDLITGLQTRTQAGRPDFDVLFRKIRANAKGRVTVYFCGSPLLGKTLKHYSHKHGLAFRHEYF